VVIIHHHDPRVCRKKLKKFIGVVYLIYSTVSFHRCKPDPRGEGGPGISLAKISARFFLRSNPRDSNKKKEIRIIPFMVLFLDIKRCLKKSHSRWSNFSKNIKQRCFVLTNFGILEKQILCLKHSKEGRGRVPQTWTCIKRWNELRGMISVEKNTYSAAGPQKII